MARKPKELRIGATDYKITSLGAAVGAELWLDILHVVAGPIEALGSLGGFDDAAIARAVAAGVRSLDHPTMNKLYAAFGPVSKIRVTANGEDRWPTLEGAVFDEHFAGNYIELTEWVGQSVYFNFFSFFGDGSLASLVERLQAMMPSTSSTT